MRQSSPRAGVSYLLPDLLLHFDRGAQLSYLFNSFAGKATVFPQHIALRMGGTNDGWPVIGSTWWNKTIKHLISWTSQCVSQSYLCIIQSAETFCHRQGPALKIPVMISQSIVTFICWLTDLGLKHIPYCCKPPSVCYLNIMLPHNPFIFSLYLSRWEQSALYLYACIECSSGRSLWSIRGYSTG